MLSGTHLFWPGQRQAKNERIPGDTHLTERYKEEKNWNATEQGIAGQHFQRLVKMKDNGMVLLAGRTGYEVNHPDMMGLVIFYASDHEAALKIVTEDPAVKTHIMLTKVHPYGVAVSTCK